MKKSTIKRRKRVVPALHDQQADQSPRSYAASVSPENSPATASEQFSASPSRQVETSPSLAFTNRDHGGQAPRYDPPPIDFTGFQMSSRPAPSEPQEMYQQRHNQQASASYNPPLVMPPIQTHPNQNQNQGQSQNQSQGQNQAQPQTQTPHQDRNSTPTEHARKRSFSIAEGRTGPADLTPDSARSTSNRLSSISSILNPTQWAPAGSGGDDLNPPNNTPIDPHSSSSSHPHPHSIGNPLAQAQQPAYGSHPMNLPPPPNYGSTRASSHDSHGPGPGTSGSSAVGQIGHMSHARREQLRREAEDLREMLRAKERELDEMRDES